MGELVSISTTLWLTCLSSLAFAHASLLDLNHSIESKTTTTNEAEQLTIVFKQGARISGRLIDADWVSTPNINKRTPHVNLFSMEFMTACLIAK